MRRRAGLAALVATAVPFLGCTGEGPRPAEDPPGAEGTPSVEAAPEPIVVVDANGRSVSLARPARRIVSLVPSATATLHAIGADAAVVGRTDFDDQPWAADLPSVGGGLEPSLEALVALDPDLVVRFAGEQDTRTRDRLDDLGLTRIDIRPESLDDIFETVRILGAVTGRDTVADSLAGEIRAGLDRVRRAASRLPRLRVAYVLGGSPPWVSGPGTYIDEILTLVGGDNVFSDLDAFYTSVGPEAMRSREIDVVLVSGPADFDERLTPDARIVRVDADLEIPGPDVAVAARRLAEALHGRPLR